MSRPVQARTARVTRLTPASSTLHRASGQRIPLGAQVTDGEALTLATPTGDGGAVTLDRRGVALRLTTVRLAPPPVAVTLAIEGGPAIVAEVEAVRTSLAAAPAASATPEAPPDVKARETRRLPMVEAAAAGPTSVEAAPTPR